MSSQCSSIVVVYFLTFKCIVEIAVTHFIDEVKEQKIKEIGLPTIEIDLSKIYRQDFKREELENEHIYQEYSEFQPDDTNIDYIIPLNEELPFN